MLIPIVAFVFQRVTLAGLAVNLAAIPCMAVVQIAAMITAAADAIGLDAIANVAGWVDACRRAGTRRKRALVDCGAVADVAGAVAGASPSSSRYYACARCGVAAEEVGEAGRGCRGAVRSGSSPRRRRWRASSATAGST